MVSGNPARELNGAKRCVEIKVLSLRQHLVIVSLFLFHIVIDYRHPVRVPPNSTSMISPMDN